MSVSGPGFKGFETGVVSESEKVTPASLGAGVDSGRILRFFWTPIRRQKFVKNRPELELLFIFGSLRSLCGHFLSKTWVNYGWIDDCTWSQQLYSQIWKSSVTGPGFKNFGTGTKSESENVTSATSAFMRYVWREGYIKLKFKICFLIHLYLHLLWNDVFFYSGCVITRASFCNFCNFFLQLPTAA